MTIRCRETLLDLTTPKVMGILNLTPDSFHDGGRYQNADAILRRVDKMIGEGADIIDIGGMSSKPGSPIIDPMEELSRVAAPIEAILQRFPDTILSIDTVHATVAHQAVDRGVAIVNDISAGELDKAMIDTVAKIQVPYIIMHMQGIPETMQQLPTYENVVKEVLDLMAAKVKKCRAAGVKDLIIDPGFGFGKTTTHNYQLLKGLSLFHMLGCPVLAGLSRKSMITRVLGIKNVDALNGTTALNMVALLNGANILRVHDVREAKETVALMNELKAAHI